MPDDKKPLFDVKFESDADKGQASSGCGSNVTKIGDTNLPPGALFVIRTPSSSLGTVTAKGIAALRALQEWAHSGRQDKDKM
jgi:hypothetical protein